MKHILKYAFIAVLFCCPAYAQETTAQRFVKAALALQNPSVSYVSGYKKIPYPMGDVSADTGVCADVVIRAYRAIGIDLQERVHKDMQANFDLYPKLWGLTAPDTNIDHRRVPNLQVFFKRQGKSLPILDSAADYKPGDIVTWNLKNTGSLPHIGIVTDKRSSLGHPMMMHNIGNGQVLEDMLFGYRITGHYRYGID